MPHTYVPKKKIPVIVPLRAKPISLILIEDRKSLPLLPT